MASVNKIILIGTISDKPQTRFGLENASSMAKFVVSVDRPQRADGSKEVDFVPVVTWGKHADYAAEYLQQGSLVLVEGRVQSRSFEENGQREWVTEVVANTVKNLIGSAGSVSTSTATAPASAAPESGLGQNPFEKSPVTEDDVPF